MASSIAKLPESLLGDQPSPQPPVGEGRASSPTMPGSTEFARPINAGQTRREYVEQLIENLHDRRTREQALHSLCKQGFRNIKVGIILSFDGALKERPELALLLWDTCNIMFLLLKEITGAYHLISTPNLTEEISIRVCNTITLFQCIAYHPEIKKSFIRASMPLYLYPFIVTESKDKPHDYLRLSSLGAIGALLKGPPPNQNEVDPEIVRFLLESQILCFCIRCMEVGSVLSRTVATFIVERILATDEGLNYCCNFGDRFYVITHVLRKMTDKLLEEPPQKKILEEPSRRQLLKRIIKCFIELSKGPRDSEGLRCCISRSLTHPSIKNLVSGDEDANRGLQKLLNNVQAQVSATGELVLAPVIES